jgi:hypothetical protein
MKISSLPNFGSLIVGMALMSLCQISWGQKVQFDESNEQENHENLILLTSVTEMAALVTDNSEPPADLIQALMMRIELIREKSVKEKMTEEQIRKWMDTFSLTQEQVESFDKIARRFAQFQPH